MRPVAIFAAMLLLLSGMLGFCPACLQAAEAQAPVDAHACCAKATGDTAPAEAPQEAPASHDEDCPQMAAVLALAHTQADGAQQPLVVMPALLAVVAIPLPVPAVAIGPAETPLLDTSPPGLSSAPLRI